MHYLPKLVPPLTIAIVTFLVALPWGMAAENRFFLPLLPLIVIHFWSQRQHQHVPEWLVFLAGLALDIFTNGPIGYWALIYLLTYAAAVVTRSVVADGPVLRWLVSSLTLIAMTALAWSVSSAYYFEFADWWPYLYAAVAAAIAYPFVAALLHGLDFHDRLKRNALLERGG